MPRAISRPKPSSRSKRWSADVKAAFRKRIEKLDWMGPATKAEALKKLDTYTIKVGYPDKWRDYSNLVIRRDDLVGNVRRSAAADWQFYVDRSNGPVDKGDWLMTPQTNDAYNGSLRDIVFPAGILQAPMFDANADPAYNYGAIGGVIGHELTHGFDDQGRTIDAARRAARLVDAQGRRRVQAPRHDPRRPICPVRAGSRSAHQARPDDGREYCRPWRPDHGRSTPIMSRCTARKRRSSTA